MNSTGSVNEFAAGASRSVNGFLEVGSGLTPTQWLVCAVAGLGFAFDLYESLMIALIVAPVLSSLGHIAIGTRKFNLWVGLFFFVPAVAGGLFGLLGGYLADLLGRRRVLLWSILLYGFSAFAAGFRAGGRTAAGDGNRRDDDQGREPRPNSDTFVS